MIAIQKVFSRSRNLYCSWHVSQNLKKKFAFLNRGKNPQKQKLYNKIISLPYAEYVSDFEENYDSLIESDVLGEKNLEYLKQRWKDRHLWVKAYMKSYFCCGMCTTSRIEAKHRVLKNYLNSSKSLVTLFQVFKELESTEIKNFKDEIRKISKRTEKKYQSSNIMKYFNFVSEYGLNKIQQELIESINYKVKKANTENSWFRKYFV